MTTIIRSQKLPGGAIAFSKIEGVKDARYAASSEAHIAARQQKVKPATSMDELFGTKTGDDAPFLKNGTGLYGLGVKRTTGPKGGDPSVAVDPHETRQPGAGRRAPAGSKPYDPSLSPFALVREKQLSALAGKAQKIADTATVVSKCVQALAKIRGSDGAMRDPELRAIANDPRFNRTIDALVIKLSKSADSLVREAKAQREAEQAAKSHPNVVGMDAAATRGFDAAIYNSLDTQGKVDYVLALKRADEYRRQVQYGNSGVTGDDVYEGLERKK